jgi:hemimethylated DNA binding protein
LLDEEEEEVFGHGRLGVHRGRGRPLHVLLEGCVSMPPLPPPSAHGRTVRALYRALWRSAGRLDRQPGDASALLAVVPLPAGLPPPPQPSSTFAGKPLAVARAALRHNFRVHRNWRVGEDVDELVALGFSALRIAGPPQTMTMSPPTPVPPQAWWDPDRPAGPPKRRPDGLTFSVGEIVQHRQRRYEGVVVGWTPSCAETEDWVAQNGVDTLPRGTRQPFYYVLVDMRDRPEPQVTYVAEENLELVVSSGGRAQQRGGPIVHPLVPRLFREFRLPGGFYVPSELLAREYPEDRPRGAGR